MKLKSLALALSLIVSTAVSAWADIVVTITLVRDPHTLTGAPSPVKQSYILVTGGVAPSVCLVLSPGGRGKLFVAGGQLGVNSTNFLVRSRHLFVGALEESCAAVLDAATDFLFRDRGLLDNLRRSSERIGDIEVVIQDLRARFGDELKVVLVGTSRGTIDMAEAATQLDVDALVLTSTLTSDAGSSPDNVFNVDLSQILLPTLLVFHEDDACFVTPPGDVEELEAGLVNAPSVRVLDFDGGFEPLSGPCQSLSAHGFFGIEPEVVGDIAERVDVSTSASTSSWVAAAAISLWAHWKNPVQQSSTRRLISCSGIAACWIIFGGVPSALGISRS